MTKTHCPFGFTVLDISKTIIATMTPIQLLTTDTVICTQIHETIFFTFSTRRTTLSIIRVTVQRTKMSLACSRKRRVSSGEFVGLKLSNKSEKGVAKGVSRVSIKRSLRHDMCLTSCCSFSSTALSTRCQICILNNGRDTFAYVITRFLRCDDDKDEPVPKRRRNV